MCLSRLPEGKLGLCLLTSCLNAVSEHEAMALPPILSLLLLKGSVLIVCIFTYQSMLYDKFCLSCYVVGPVPFDGKIWAYSSCRRVASS